MAKTILVATTNAGKFAEFQAMLDAGITWLSLADVPPLPDVEEDGLTFAENARKKATAYARLSGHWAISDDSGLEVDALDGAPGIHSARFSGVNDPDRRVVDRANLDKLLSLMVDVPVAARTARFRCCLCLATPERVLLQTGGCCEGRIADRPSGEQGFGYDPVFFLPDLGRTAAELSAEQKNALSHRGQAIRAIKPPLMALLSTD